MRKVLVAVLFTCLCGATGPAEIYSIDPDHTHATFSFEHLGFSTFKGKIPSRSGKIALDRIQKTGTAEIVFDLNQVTTGVPEFDDHLRSADFFDVERHPTATFKATKISFEGDAPSVVEGTLTIKDVAKPVTLQVTSFNCGQHPMKKAPACGANASATIKRSDFGLTYALPAVRDEIGLEIEVEAIQE